MAALSHSKTRSPEAPSKAPTGGATGPQSGLAPESNSEALGALGLGAVPSLEEGAAPPAAGLAGEIAAMDPSLVPIVLDGIPVPILVFVLPDLLAVPAVRAWLLDQSADLILRIPGAAQALADFTLPIGHYFGVDAVVEAELKGTLEQTNGFRLTRVSEQEWELEVELDTQVGLSQGVDEKGGGVKAEAKAEVAKGQRISALFSQSMSIVEVVTRLVEAGSPGHALGKVAKETLEGTGLKEFKVERTLKAGIDTGFSAEVVAQMSPAMGVKVLEVGADFDVGLDVGAAWSWDQESGSLLHFTIGADGKFGKTLAGFVPEVAGIAQVAKTEGVELEITVDPKLSEGGGGVSIQYTEDMAGHEGVRRFDSVGEFLGAMFRDDRFKTVTQRWAELPKDGSLEVTFKEELPEDAMVTLMENLKGPSGSQLKVEQSAVLSQAVQPSPVPMPEYMDAVSFGGSDMLLLREVASIARGEGGTTLGARLSQGAALGLLSIQAPRVALDAEAMLGVEEEKRGVELSVGTKFKAGFDLPYTGPERIF